MKNIVGFIHRVATGKRHTRIVLAPVFAAFFLSLVLLAVFLAVKSDEVFNLSGPVGYPWDCILSLPLLAVGVFLWVWSVLHFVKARGTPHTCQPTPNPCRFRTLRLHEKPDAYRRVFRSFRGRACREVPVPFVLLYAVFCGLQCSRTEIYRRTGAGEALW